MENITFGELTMKFEILLYPNAPGRENDFTVVKEYCEKKLMKMSYSFR